MGRWFSDGSPVGLLLAAGCSKSKGTVKGTVYYKDKTDGTYKPSVTYPTNTPAQCRAPPSARAKPGRSAPSK